MSSPERLLLPAEAAARLRITTRRLHAWALRGLIPAVVTPDGRRLYRPEDVEAMAESLGVAS